MKINCTSIVYSYFFRVFFLSLIGLSVTPHTYCEEEESILSSLNLMESSYFLQCKESGHVFAKLNDCCPKEIIKTVYFPSKVKFDGPISGLMSFKIFQVKGDEFKRLFKENVLPDWDITFHENEDGFLHFKQAFSSHVLNGMADNLSLKNSDSSQEVTKTLVTGSCGISCTEGDNKLVVVDYEDTPMSEVIRDFEVHLDGPIFFDPSVLETRVFIKLSGVPLENALKILSEMHDFNVSKESDSSDFNIYYITL